MKMYLRNTLMMLGLCFLALAACGGHDISDTEADAGVAIDGAPKADGDVTNDTATIVTVGGDYAGSGVLTLVKVPEMEVTVNAVAGVVGGDPVLRHIGDKLFILDRFGGDSVTVLDTELNLLGQVSTGAGSNPQDIAVIGNTLYVAAYDAAGVLVIDLDNIAGGIVETIDLSALDPDDQVPDCNSIAAVGDKLFVTCQIVNRETFAPRGYGKLAVVDTSDNSVVTLDLSASNPFAFLKALPNGDLAFSTAPGALFGGSNEGGCLEHISTSGTPSLLPCLSNNSELNAYPAELASVDELIYFINVAGFSESDVRVYDGSSVAPAGLSPVGSNLAGLASCPTGHLVVADNTDGARGLRVFDADRTAAHNGVLDVGWPATFAPNNATVCW